MVEEVVVIKEAMTRELINTGRNLLEQLDKLSLKTIAAFWKYLPEVNVWRFVVASPEVDEFGPREVYGKIRSAISQLPEEQRDVFFINISAVGADDQLVAALLSQAKAGYDLSGKRLKNTAINGHYIDDVYIYRVTP